MIFIAPNNKKSSIFLFAYLFFPIVGYGYEPMDPPQNFNKLLKGIDFAWKAKVKKIDLFYEESFSNQDKVYLDYANTKCTEQWINRKNLGYPAIKIAFYLEKPEMLYQKHPLRMTSKTIESELIVVDYITDIPENCHAKKMSKEMVGKKFIFITNIPYLSSDGKAEVNIKLWPKIQENTIPEWWKSNINISPSILNVNTELFVKNTLIRKEK
ncbi:hypothetical protein [Chitinivorax sp. B]|uniref:hypothetical protein n=1 Tax=Chitinivorax sp. B TaxID=2502235 RepID=UPI0010F6EDDB|nr:hypothetical protein [Chitinivorax sp. B]